ncbi:hypothetical protein AN958_07085 [Leucoagaricus sp. SymC.cos]|nr:hypothetical protein AN958_07085 [Leucoagaricus sp. SymC.cos]
MAEVKDERRVVCEPMMEVQIWRRREKRTEDGENGEKQAYESQTTYLLAPPFTNPDLSTYHGQNQRATNIIGQRVRMVWQVGKHEEGQSRYERAGGGCSNGVRSGVVRESERSLQQRWQEALWEAGDQLYRAWCRQRTRKSGKRNL